MWPEQPDEQKKFTSCKARLFISLVHITVSSLKELKQKQTSQSLV